MSKHTLVFITLLFLALPLLHARRGQDTACRGIRCMGGFRCKDGSCIPQRKSPVKNLCMPHEFTGKIKGERCSPKDRSQNCQNAKNALSCGFTTVGTKLDFTNECSPCLNPSVLFYFRLPCADAPSICHESQQCINGKCFDMFDEDNDQNRNKAICNKSADCDDGTQICVANKCVGRDELLRSFRSNRVKRNNYK